MKTTKELKYVHYILKVKDKTTEIWSNIILSKIRKRIMDGSSSYDGKYIPTNIEWSNNEVKMKEKSAVITEFQGVRLIKLNPRGAQLVYIGLGEDWVHLSTVRNIRAALFQLNDDVEEQKLLTEQLVKLLEEKRNENLSKFLSESQYLEAVTEAD